MNKKKLICVIGGCFVLLMMTFIDLSFSGGERSIMIDNQEAIAQEEIDYLKLCPASGGHCMISNTMDIYGISMEAN